MEALIVEDDEAVRLAHALAERRGVSVAEAVVTSLRAALDAPLAPGRAVPRAPVVPVLADLTPEQRAEYEALGVLAREVAPHRIPGTSSDHGDMYDAHGLPV